MKYRVKRYGQRTVKSNLNGDNLGITVILIMSPLKDAHHLKD